MSDYKFPVKISAYILGELGSSKEPIYTELIYNITERESFMQFITSQKNKYQLKQFKPKLKELKRLNWFEKLSYVIPFKTELSDILVDAVKIIIGIIIGVAAKSILGQ